MSNTPETHEAVERWRQGKINIFDEMARLERERDLARNLAESAMLEADRLRSQLWRARDRAWKLACERSHWKLDCLEQCKLLAMSADREEKLRTALQRLADCDWVISLPDRMDAVRKIAREALQ
jgi:hypothetical protein